MGQATAGVQDVFVCRDSVYVPQNRAFERCWYAVTETHVEALEGTQVRYNDDTWEFTGTIDVRRNGEVIHANVRKTDRVRKNSGTLRFTLQDPPASLNPGNLGTFDVKIEKRDDAQYLVVVRPNSTNQYRLDSMNYN